MIVLLGASGYVGNALAKSLKRKGLSSMGLSRKQLEYSDPKLLSDFLRSVDADFLINAAGYTGKPNVDACENDKANCLFGNAVLPGRIAEACQRVGIPWGHVSSGCIYTGTRGNGFTEEDAPNFSFRQNNCSFYSGTKALGEEVLEDTGNVYIWRLRIPFDQLDGPRNYLSKLMRYDRLLEATNSISELTEFADACVESYLQNLPFGTYNVTNPGAITTSEVVALIEEVLRSGKEYSFFENEREFMGKAAVAPRSNCVLDSTKILNQGIKLSPAHDAIRSALLAWQPEGNPEVESCST